MTIDIENVTDEQIIDAHNNASETARTTSNGACYTANAELAKLYWREVVRRGLIEKSYTGRFEISGYGCSED